jgi:hypothetical protein
MTLEFLATPDLGDGMGSVCHTSIRIGLTEGILRHSGSGIEKFGIMDIQCPENDEGIGGDFPSGLEIDPAIAEISEPHQLIRTSMQIGAMHTDILDTPLLQPPVFVFVFHGRTPEKTPCEVCG